MKGKTNKAAVLICKRITILHIKQFKMYDVTSEAFSTRATPCDVIPIIDCFCGFPSPDMSVMLLALELLQVNLKISSSDGLCFFLSLEGFAY